MDRLKFEISESDLIFYNSCIVCGTSNIFKISDVSLENGLKFFSTAFCNSCGHIFRDITPSENWFTSNFEMRDKFQVELKINPLNPVIEKERYQRYSAIGSLLQKKYPMAKTFLDVGCGPGTGLDALKERGFNISGIDSDQSRSELAKAKGHTIFQGNWKDYRGETRFDIISSIHSLEHFHNPGDFLRKIKEFSHEETILYIEVPEVTDTVVDWNDSLYLAHLSNFNEYSLRKLAELNGWSFTERVFPYSETPLHQNHLCMIFSYENKESKEIDVKSNIQKTLKPLVLRAYNERLPVKVDSYPLKFVVQEINDLSLTFKRSMEVKKTVRENYQNREIKLFQNHYYVV